jgi:hypothetical protein
MPYTRRVLACASHPHPPSMHPASCGPAHPPWAPFPPCPCSLQPGGLPSLGGSRRCCVGRRRRVAAIAPRGSHSGSAPPASAQAGRTSGSVARRSAGILGLVHSQEWRARHDANTRAPPCCGYIKHDVQASSSAGPAARRPGAAGESRTDRHRAGRPRRSPERGGGMAHGSRMLCAAIRRAPRDPEGGGRRSQIACAHMRRRRRGARAVAHPAGQRRPAQLPRWPDAR